MELNLCDFLKEEFDTTVNTALNCMGKNKFSYIFITDMHVDKGDCDKEIINQCNAAVLLANKLNVDCIIIGGDVIHGCNSNENSVMWLNRIADIFSLANCPTFTVRGNHDSNPYCYETELNTTVREKYIVKDSQWYDAMLGDKLTRGRAVHDHSKEKSSYYYVDFPNLKLRGIFLDPYDFPIEFNGEYLKYVSETWNRLSDEQMNWLATQALGTTPDDWNVRIFCHTSDWLPDFKPFTNSEECHTLFKAFNSHGEASIDRLGIHVNYGEKHSEILQFHLGHTHRDGNAMDKETGILYINTSHAKTIPYYPNNGDVQRVRNTSTESLFDVVICDDDKGKVNRIRFGAGHDEEFNL